MPNQSFWYLLAVFLKREEWKSGVIPSCETAPLRERVFFQPQVCLVSHSSWLIIEILRNLVKLAINSPAAKVVSSTTKAILDETKQIPQNIDV